MIPIVWTILFLSAFIGAWLACIERAMLLSTPLVLRHELEIRGTPQRALWISNAFESIVQSVAFVRYASVYRRFQDVEEFEKEIESLRDTPSATDARSQISIFPEEEDD